MLQGSFASAVVDSLAFSFLALTSYLILHLEAHLPKQLFEADWESARMAWVDGVKVAGTASELAPSLLDLEAALQREAFVPSWQQPLLVQVAHAQAQKGPLSSLVRIVAFTPVISPMPRYASQEGSRLSLARPADQNAPPQRSMGNDATGPSPHSAGRGRGRGRGRGGGRSATPSRGRGRGRGRGRRRPSLDSSGMEHDSKQEEAQVLPHPTTTRLPHKHASASWRARRADQ